MIGTHSSRAAPRQAAVFLRLTAFLVTAASVVVIPSELGAAAVGHVSTGTAFTIIGVMAAATLATIAVARGVDPLRN